MVEVATVVVGKLGNTHAGHAGEPPHGISMHCRMRISTIALHLELQFPVPVAAACAHAVE